MRVLLVEPLFIKTNMVKKWDTSFFVLTPQNVVESTLLKLVLTNFKKTAGNWRHALQSSILNLIPNFIFNRLAVIYFNKQTEKIRHKLKRF